MSAASGHVLRNEGKSYPRGYITYLNLSEAKSGMRTYLGKIEVTLLAGYFCSPGNFFVTDFLSGSSGHVIVTAVQVLLRPEKKLQFI